VMWSFVLTSVICAGAVDVEVRTVGGETHTGSFIEVTAEEIAVQTADGPVRLATKSVMGVAPKGTTALTPESIGAWVQLVDGSSILAQQVTATRDRAQVTLVGGRILEIPTADVATVRFRQQSDEMAEEWTRIVGLELSGDVLIAIKGEALNYYSGVLGDIDEETVKFELDGDVLPVKRSKVHGLVYRHPPGRQMPESLCHVIDAGGSIWSAAAVSVTGDTLTWTTPTGTEVARPLGDVLNLDFSRGKVLYLSDLAPETTQWTPYFSPARIPPALASFYAPRQDRALEQGPLRLADVEYAKGLALHSRTQLVYRLPGRFSRFKAIAGIDDRVRPRGNVRLVITGDGETLLEATVTGQDDPLPIDLDLTGVRRLGILVDFGEQLDLSDHLDLCQARVSK